jgi:hypothetical protein
MLLHRAYFFFSLVMLAVLTACIITKSDLAMSALLLLVIVFAMAVLQYGADSSNLFGYPRSQIPHVRIGARRYRTKRWVTSLVRQAVLTLRTQ